MKNSYDFSICKSDYIFFLFLKTMYVSQRWSVDCICFGQAIQFYSLYSSSLSLKKNKHSITLWDARDYFNTIVMFRKHMEYFYSKSVWSEFVIILLAPCKSRKSLCSSKKTSCPLHDIYDPCDIVCNRFLSCSRFPS